MEAKILTCFQICISIPLREHYQSLSILYYSSITDTIQSNGLFENWITICIKCRSGQDSHSFDHAQFSQISLKSKVVTKWVCNWRGSFLTLF